MSPYYPWKTTYFWKEELFLFPKIYSLPWVLWRYFSCSQHDCPDFPHISQYISTLFAWPESFICHNSYHNALIPSLTISLGKIVLEILVFFFKDLMQPLHIQSHVFFWNFEYFVPLCYIAFVDSRAAWTHTRRS